MQITQYFLKQYTPTIDLSEGGFFCLFCIVCFIFSISLIAKKQLPNVSEYSAVQLSEQSGARRGMNVKAQKQQ